MPKGWWITRRRRDRGQGERGFSVVEVLLAASVFGVLTLGLVGALVYGRTSTAEAGDSRRAQFLAEEGLEAARSIGGASFANLVNGSYGLQQTGSPLSWSFKAAGTTDITGIYTRQITVATGGTNRKTITSTVTWSRPGTTTGSISLSTTIVNWAAALKLWSNAIASGGANLSGSGLGLKVAAQGNYAYIVLNATSNNFVIADISNPASPVVRSTISLTGTPTNIAVKGNFAYVTDQSNTAELVIVNITNPAAPTSVGTYNAAGNANGQSVAVVGNTVYLARAANSSNDEFVILDVTNPTAPTRIGGYSNNLTMTGLYISGTNAFIATTSTTQEMLVVNISNPASPTLTLAYNAPTSLAPTTMTGYGNTVLLGMSTTLDAINVTTPSAPTVLGAFTAAGTINDVAVDITNQVAFLGTASTSAEVQVVNIGAPASMTLAKSVNLTGSGSSLGVTYDSSLDVGVAATNLSTLELELITRN